MSVKVNAGGQSSSGGLSNILQMYGAYKQLSAPDQAAPKPPQEMSAAAGQGAIDWGGNDYGQNLDVMKGMNSTQGGLVQDPYMDSMNAIQRRQAKSVNPPQPGKSGLSNVMGAAGILGAFA